MILEDLLDNKYPNASFHDATIQKVEINYIEKQAIFNILMYVGDPDAKNEEDREKQRTGELTVFDLIYYVIEPPDSSYPYQEGKGLWITSDGPTNNNKQIHKDSRTKLTDNLPNDAFAHYFFVDDWNAFIYIAAKSARFKWLE